MKNIMKNLPKKFKAIFLIIILILTVFAVFSVFAEPGEEGDPVVSLSYIQNKVIPELKSYVDAKLASFSSNGGAPQFEVIELKAGDRVICGASSELILRMGSATIIASEKGGLADTTAGYDLQNGEKMPSNHLLIVPLGDGRGMKADTDAIIMVRGNYNIE